MNRKESPPASTRTFTPTERQSELEALRQRGLTTQLNRHFNEQVAKVALQNDPVNKRPRTTTTTTKVSANREISPLDAIYLSITKWRRESRQAMHPRHSISPEATVKSSTCVELPELEIPVRDAAHQIETNLQEYVQTGALPLTSVESMLRDATYNHEKCLTTNSIVAEQIDARCTPTAKKVAAYVGPGAFLDCISADGFDTEGEIEEKSSSTSTSVTHEDEPSKLAVTSRGDDHDVSKQVLVKTVCKPCALREKDNCDFWDAPPALVASPRSTDDTCKQQTKPLFATNNGFMCGVAVLVAIGMYYSLGLQHHL